MTITATALLARVRGLAHASPDTVSGCMYVDLDGTPCCIIGQALALEGADMSVFSDDDLNMSTDVTGLFYDEAERLGLAIDDHKAVNALADIQKAQDRRVPWGSATGDEI